MPKKKILKNHQLTLQEIREPFDVKSAEAIAKKYKFKTTNYETLAEKLNKAYEYYPTDKNVYQDQKERLSEQKERLRRIEETSQKLFNKLEQIAPLTQDLFDLLYSAPTGFSKLLRFALPKIEHTLSASEVENLLNQLPQFMFTLKQLNKQASTALQKIPPDKGGSKPSAEPLIFLIIRLANIYEEETGEKPTGGYYDIKKRHSPFYNFVKDYLSISQLNHELKNLLSNIKKALAIRKLRPDHQ